MSPSFTKDKETFSHWNSWVWLEPRPFMSDHFPDRQRETGNGSYNPYIITTMIWDTTLESKGLRFKFFGFALHYKNGWNEEFPLSLDNAAIWQCRWVTGYTRPSILTCITLMLRIDMSCLHYRFNRIDTEKSKKQFILLANKRREDEELSLTFRCRLVAWFKIE